MPKQKAPKTSKMQQADAQSHQQHTKPNLVSRLREQTGQMPKQKAPNTSETEQMDTAKATSSTPNLHAG
jgi:predicted patatin/cPLA2 family phospholipase